MPSDDETLGYNPAGWGDPSVLNLMQLLLLACLLLG
jgi:hypothetical protein